MILLLNPPVSFRTCWFCVDHVVFHMLLDCILVFTTESHSSESSEYETQALAHTHTHTTTPVLPNTMSALSCFRDEGTGFSACVISAWISVYECVDYFLPSWKKTRFIYNDLIINKVGFGLAVNIIMSLM